MEKSLITVGPHTVEQHVFAKGKKTSLILVHGLGVSADYYTKYAEMLEPYYDVYLVDLPGYGGVPKPDEPLSVPELADVLVQYVKEIGVTKSVLIGQSMGCQIVAHAAKNVPQLFSRVILLSPTVNRKERSLFKQSLRLIQDTFHESLRIKLVVLKNYFQMGMREYLITTRHMIEDHIESVIDKVSLPVLVVSGSKDTIVPKEWAVFLANTAPNGQHVEIKDAPHLLQYQKPEALLKITRSFIE